MVDARRRTSILAAPQLALLREGVGVSIASRDADHLPDLVRGVGHRVERSGQLTVFVSRVDGAGVLANLLANGAIAVVFSQPSTHRTLQVKANRVTISDARKADLATVERCREAMARELVLMGFPHELMRRLLSFDPAQLAAVRLLPESAFDQTPGPRAGTPLLRAG